MGSYGYNLNMGEEGKLFVTVESKLVNKEEIMLTKNQWMLKTSWWNSDEEQDVYIVLKHLPTTSLLIRKETVLL